MRGNRGFSLLELIFAMGLSLVVLGAGYGAYFSVNRADDVERRREEVTISAHDAMSQIKTDVRQAGAASVSGSVLTMTTADGRITYRDLRDGSGIERRTSAMRSVLKGATASFAQSGRGVSIAIKSQANIHGRAIRVDLKCFVTPRNR